MSINNGVFFGFKKMVVILLYCSSESQEVIDAELSARVLQLVKVMDSGLHGEVWPL